ncbi:MAG TPA: CPBP family intramembrane metalloprotease [Firmicutes bacterium]|nr:CPBP family intramembrane metalloprotease [Bacillota bacterium]
MKIEIKARQKFCIVVVFLGLFILVALSRFFQPAPSLVFSLLACQQLLFFAGGAFGARRDVLNPPKFKRVIVSFLGGIGLFLANTASSALVLQLSSRFLGSELTAQLVSRERGGIDLFLQSENPLFAKGIIFLLIVGAPLSEELFFRGLFLDFWRSKIGALRATLLAAAAFAVLHFYLIQFIPVLLAGILLGVMFVRSDNIFVPAIAHGVANTLVLLILLAHL